MRMIVAGGGTGGHLFPGLAVAEAASASGDAEVLFVGSAYGIEARAVPRTPFPFEALRIQGLRGRGLSGVLTFAWQLPAAVLRAWRIVGTFRPQVVVGLGGYGSVPVVLAAWLRGLPSVLLEQNARPGWANRCLGRIARRVCTAFADSGSFFPAGKAIHTGNPVRQLASTLRPDPHHFTIFIFGGSQGARSINRAAVEAARILSTQMQGLRIIHQTGAADLQWVTEHYRDAGVAAEVHGFIDDMGDAYARADVVICRAGATTLAELAALAKPSILVPYPFAGGHQQANAMELARHGAAEVIGDTELTGERLAATIAAVAGDRARLEALAEAAGQLAVCDATARVVDVCRQVAAGGGRG